MTEIPEHLLKRSRERREALGLPTEGGASAESAAASGSSEASATTPAISVPSTPVPAARPAAPVPAAPPPVRPDPPYVAAAKQRRRIPIWAMPVLALLPLWALMYAQAMRPVDKELVGPLATGEEIYSQCSSCHGAEGGGGVGYPFVDGSVLATFPSLEDQVAFVASGSQPFAGQPYGDPNRPGGARIGLARNGSPMPAFGTTLSEAELVAVICHERYTLGGGDETGEEFLQWCAEDAPGFLEAEAAG